MGVRSKELLKPSYSKLNTYTVKRWEDLANLKDEEHECQQHMRAQFIYFILVNHVDSRTVWAVQMLRRQLEQFKHFLRWVVSIPAALPVQLKHWMKHRMVRWKCLQMRNAAWAITILVDDGEATSLVIC